MCLTSAFDVGGETANGPAIWFNGVALPVELGWRMPFDPPGEPLRRRYGWKTIDFRGSKALSGPFGAGLEVWNPSAPSIPPKSLAGDVSLIRGLAINGADVVAGYAINTNTGRPNPCIWLPPAYAIQLLPFDVQGKAFAIDAGGTVYGSSADRACRWVNGSLEYLTNNGGTYVAGVASNGDILIGGSSGTAAIRSGTLNIPILQSLPSGFGSTFMVYKINANRQLLVSRPNQPWAIVTVPPAPRAQQMLVEYIGCAGGTAQFVVSTTGAGPFTYQWRREGAPIDASPAGNSSASTATLILTNITPADAGRYDCIVTNPCGSVTSNPATLTICIGDFNCDGGVDGPDVSAFFADWESGSVASDVNTDGGIDGADVDTFFEHWERGC